MEEKKDEEEGCNSNGGTEEDNNVAYENVPNDIIVEILLKLQVKSLLNCKSVCKKWYNLITTPNFIQNHMDNQSPKLLVPHYNRPYSHDKLIVSIFPDENLSGNPPPHHYFHHLDIHISSIIHLYGPVDGLFLVLHYEGDANNVTLWNPATRESRPLHLPISIPEEDQSHWDDTFLFGRHPSKNEYKVVWFHKLNGVVICTLDGDEDSWRFLQPNISSFRDPEAIIFRNLISLNGVYYFVVKKYPDLFKIALIDMGTEQFREIEESPIKASDSRIKFLTAYKNYLAIICYLYEDVESGVGDFNLWVMEQEGCWTKHLTFRPSVGMRNFVNFRKSDEVLLRILLHIWLCST